MRLDAFVCRSIAALVAVIITTSANAVCPVDNFDDGDNAGWIQCGEWGGREEPVWDASSGRYCLGINKPIVFAPPPPLSVASEWTQAGGDSRYANGCVMATFRSGSVAEGTWRTHFVMGLRADCKSGGYKAMIGPSLGRLSIFRVRELLADDLESAFEQDTDYRVKFCAVDDQLSLKVWPLDDAEPARAQLETSNARYNEGNIGLGVFVENGNNGPNVLGCFDDVQFEARDQCRGDSNCDGLVDGKDLVGVAMALWSQDRCHPANAADVNHDCEVSWRDVQTVIEAWGSCASL